MDTALRVNHPFYTRASRFKISAAVLQPIHQQTTLKVPS